MAASEAPEIEQPVKDVPEESAEPAEKLTIANGVHAADDATPEKPDAQEQAGASEQVAVDVIEESSQPVLASEQSPEQNDDTETVPEVESDVPRSSDDQPEPEAAPAPATPAPREDLSPQRRRLWFVRMPKPAEEPGSAAEQSELESYKTQVGLLNESLNVKRLERDEATERAKAAQDAFNQIRQKYEDKRAVAEPHRERRRELREIANKLQAEFKEEYGDLPAKNEAELEGILGELHHRMTHESLPLNEEKKCLAQIKKLEASRDKVREYGIKAAGVREARAAAAAASGGNEDLEAEVQALFDEMQTQRQILDKYKDEETAVREEWKGINEERKRVKGLQDAKWKVIHDARNEKRDKHRHWSENRRFSQNIRQVLARPGALEEARRMCEKQMDEAHALLRSDAAYLAEYMKLWEGQRKNPTSPYFEDDTVDLLAAGGRKGVNRKGSGSGTPAVDEGAKARAEAVVANALKQASDTLKRQKERE